MQSTTRYNGNTSRVQRTGQWIGRTTRRDHDNEFRVPCGRLSKGLGHVVFPLTYSYNVQVNGTTKLPPFCTEITRLRHGTISIARLMPLNVSKIYLPLAYRLRLMHRAPIPRKKAYTNPMKSKVGYKKDYDKHIPFEAFFAVNDYIFAERPSLMASATDCMAYERFCKHLPRHTGPYRVSNVRRSTLRMTSTVSETLYRSNA